MKRNAVISQTAEIKLKQLFSYLEENWSVKVKSDFVRKLDENIERIREQPETFPESLTRKGLRKCVITKHTAMYYRFNSRQIKIVTIFDNRQDPNKLLKP